MRSVSSTISRLASSRVRPAFSGAGLRSPHLNKLSGFGSNPGTLDAWFYAPEPRSQSLPLVVVLHGCTQDAASYDAGSGWSQVAEEYGFALLLPEQSRANNVNRCFNWFEPADSRRDGGEPLSIWQMIEAMVERHGVDRERIFVTGLSAGGAMTSVMLATYPEIFVGGAIIAGLPYGSASTVPEAFDRMRGHGGPNRAALAASVREASPHRGPWPSVAVWHGSADRVVDVSNARTIVEQWRDVHGVEVDPSETGVVDGYPYRVWRDATGRAVVEEFQITGMGHGTPLSTGGDDGCGKSGAYMLEVAISSTRHIATGWGLTDGPRKVAAPADAGCVDDAGKSARLPVASGVGQVIEDALRAAGLMR